VGGLLAKNKNIEETFSTKACNFLNYGIPYLAESWEFFPSPRCIHWIGRSLINKAIKPQGEDIPNQLITNNLSTKCQCPPQPFKSQSPMGSFAIREL